MKKFFMVLGVIVLFLGVVISWVSVLYIASCGFTTSCKKADHIVERTPVPTLIPAGHLPDTDMAVVEFNKCEVAATDLIGAWVAADSPESEPFPFTDVNDQPCEGTFANDIQPLFVENSLWHTSMIGCVSCHNSALTERSGGIDLTSYTAITKGSDILGGGNWESSALFNVLVNQGLVAEGHSAEEVPSELVLYAGEHVEASATPTP